VGAPVRGGDVYEIVSHEVMTLTFAAVGLFVALALLIGFLRFWRNVGEPYSELANPSALTRAAKDVLCLENLDNGGVGQRSHNPGGIAIARPPLLLQFRSSVESPICRTASG
jgi:hypothetical protein